MSSRPGPGGLREELGYDLAGHLVRVDLADGSSVAYGYDGDNNLLSRGDARGLTRFVRAGATLLLEVGPDATTQHVPGESPGERLGFIRGGRSYYLVQHPDGSTVAVLDGGGHVLARYLHEPFGAAVVAAGSVPDPWHYRGTYSDAATGLVHYPMRWYDPQVGAFVAPDPDAGDLLFPETLDRYAYLGGDPVGQTDPIGAQAHEWQLGKSSLDAVCNTFQQGGIKAIAGVKNALDGYSYAGAVERHGWQYDVWLRRVPGSDKMLTIFRDLNEKSEGFLGKPNISGNIVLQDPPAIAKPIGASAPSASQGGLGGTLRAGVEQVKLGAQLYGKEITGTVAGLGGLSGTLGTGVGTLAGLPGGLAIIGIAGVGAGAAGYGTGVLINMIPGVSEGAQAGISSVLGFPADQAAADLKAQAELEGPKVKEATAKKIGASLASGTASPSEPPSGVAGAPVDLGPPDGGEARDPGQPREHDGHDVETARDAVTPPQEGEGEDEEGDDEGPAAPEGAPIADLLDRVAARRIAVAFSTEQDMSAGKFKNIVTRDMTLSFWNVGAMAAGYGQAGLKGVCVASLNGARDEPSATGSFSGGPDGVVTLGGAALQLRGGVAIDIPEVGERPLPADAFADWPKDAPRR